MPTVIPIDRNPKRKRGRSGFQLYPSLTLRVTSTQPACICGATPRSVNHGRKRKRTVVHDRSSAASGIRPLLQHPFSRKTTRAAPSLRPRRKRRVYYRLRRKMAMNGSPMLRPFFREPTELNVVSYYLHGTTFREISNFFGGVGGRKVIVAPAGRRRIPFTPGWASHWQQRETLPWIRIPGATASQQP